MSETRRKRGGRKERRRFSKKFSNEWGTSGKELGRKGWKGRRAKVEG